MVIVSTRVEAYLDRCQHGLKNLGVRYDDSRVEVESSAHALGHV
jgi:hypothetical protein